VRTAVEIPPEPRSIDYKGESCQRRDAGSIGSFGRAPASTVFSVLVKLGPLAIVAHVGSRRGTVEKCATDV